MKLEKFNKNKKRNRIVACSVIGILLIVGNIALIRTYAFYESNKDFNVLKGQIPSHWYDMDVLSVVVNGEEKESIPARGPYKVEANCGDTKGEWDYNAWSLNLSNLKENTRCNVTFTSNALSDEEYQEYIEAGKSLRRNTYRGKDISRYLSLPETDNMNLYKQIEKGTFDDIYVGDKIIANGLTWLVADIDNYLYSGKTRLTKHHLTIIPAKPLAYSGMNSTGTNEGKYIGSEMCTGNIQDSTKVTTSLPKLLEEKIEPTFVGHVLEYDYYASKSVYDEHWEVRKLDLMSEQNVYGSNIWSKDVLEIGLDNRQYAIFQLRPEMINSYGADSFGYWLKNISPAPTFVSVFYRGEAYSVWGADGQLGIRPRFLIG